MKKWFSALVLSLVATLGGAGLLDAALLERLTATNLVSVKGHLTARVNRGSGFVTLWERPVPNLVLNAGKAWVAYLLMDDATPTSFTHSAIGSGTTAAAAADTELETELNRVTPTRSRITTSVTNDTAKFVSLHTASTAWNVSEFGITTAASAGTFFTRIVFTAIPLAQDDQLEFTYQVQVTSV